MDDRVASFGCQKVKVPCFLALQLFRYFIAYTGHTVAEYGLTIDDPQHIFSLWYVTTSMQHLPGERLDRLNLLLCFPALVILVYWPSFFEISQTIVYESPMETTRDLIEQIVVVARDINSTNGIFQRVLQSILYVCQLCNEVRWRNYQQIFQ